MKIISKNIYESSGLEFKDFFSNHTTSDLGFTHHIQSSIPGYKEMEDITVNILLKILPKNSLVLDIGASEGTWGKNLTQRSNGSIKTDSLDPNSDMENTFNKSKVAGANFIKKAWGSGFQDGNENIEGYAPNGIYDVIRESMTFQFISTDRSTQYGLVSKGLKPDGIFITNSKNHLPDKNEYKRFEELKDEYKRKTFSQEEIDKKAKDILPNMSKYMVELETTMSSLKKHFKYVRQYWVSGNFHGFIASNSDVLFKKFIQSLPNTFPNTVAGKIIPPEDAFSNLAESYLNKESHNNHITNSINELVSAADLSYIKQHSILHPDFFDNDEVLKEDVRKHLLAIANTFHNSFDVDVEIPISDIILTGSLANYNWTTYSDVDLHLLLDFKKINNDINFVSEFFAAKKNLWNDNRNIVIKNHDVELYCQDIHEKHYSTGVYSLVKNKWIIKPHNDMIVFDRKKVADKANSYIKSIDSAISSKNLKKLNQLKVKIKNIRQSGLKSTGEFSIENLAFKVLRNLGYLDKLSEIKTDIEDSKLSLK